MKLDAILRYIEREGDPFAALGLSRTTSDADVERALTAERREHPNSPALAVLADPELRARLRLLLPTPAADLGEVKHGVRRELGYVGPGPWRTAIRELSAGNHEDATCNKSR